MIRRDVPAKIGRNDPCPCGSGRKAKNCCLAHGPTDAAFILATQPAPMARLAARWLSAARRGVARGDEPDEAMRSRAEQFLRVCRGWNPDGYDENGRPAGPLAVLGPAFGGSANAVYAALAVGLAHLLLDQRDDARAWLHVLAGDEPHMLSALASIGLPTGPFEGLPETALGWIAEQR